MAPKWRVKKRGAHWMVTRPNGSLLGGTATPHLFGDWSTAHHTALWHAGREGRI